MIFLFVFYFLPLLLIIAHNRRALHKGASSQVDRAFYLFIPGLNFFIAIAVLSDYIDNFLSNLMEKIKKSKLWGFLRRKTYHFCRFVTGREMFAPVPDGIPFRVGDYVLFPNGSKHLIVEVDRELKRIYIQGPVMKEAYFTYKGEVELF